MAVVAFPIGQDMRRCFRGCPYEAAFRVTTGTGKIGRAEGAAYVTVLASHIGMRTIEYEAGTEVIKCCLCVTVFKREQTEQASRDQDQSAVRYSSNNSRHWIDLTSVNEFAVWQRPQFAPNSPSWMSCVRWHVRQLPSIALIFSRALR